MTWVQLVEPQKKLQMLTLNTCGLSLEAATKLAEQIGPDHHDLTYIDLYGNDLGDEIVKIFAGVMDRYDLLEFIGLGKNGLRDCATLVTLLDKIGRREVNAQYVAYYNERVRERNLIIEKNKKLRTMKKPEEWVFYLDSLIFNADTNSRRG